MNSDLIEDVRVDRIRIVNPRTRNRVTWQTIVTSIRAVGLKKPIMVSRRSEPDAEGNTHDLVCGQGRLEACREIGLPTIPAIITDASGPDQYLMSLIENVARRPSSNKSLYYEVRTLLSRGYDMPTISKKLGIDRSYVHGITRLVEQEEPTLIAAVESGRLPLTVAMHIANGEDEGVQRALMELYESGQMRGAKLRAVRMLIKERRQRQSGRTQTSRKALTGAALASLYKQRVREQQRLVAKADQARESLLIIATVMRTLLADENFQTLLRAEDLADMPEQLASRIN